MTAGAARGSWTTRRPRDRGAGWLTRLRASLGAAPVWGVSELETLLKSFAESEGVGFGKFGPSLRGILTGGAQAPDLNKIMTALGRDESLGRLDDALASRA